LLKIAENRAFSCMGNHKIKAQADRRALSLSSFLRDCLYLNSASDFTTDQSL
jgi:hypothetical protein